MRPTWRQRFVDWAHAGTMVNGRWRHTRGEWARTLARKVAR